MKNDSSKNLIAKLNRIKEEFDFLARPDSKAAFQKNLDDLIAALNRLRAGLANTSLETKAAEIQRPLEQVIEFLEFAKSDEVLKTLLLPARKTVAPKPKRQPVEIANSLTNEQIRALLEKELSKVELKAIAKQRAISVGKSNNEEIKRNILKNLERQEGYGRLATV
jgi:ABC-type Zn uptake system ZnuABC Zn-binding protein ZnuA